MISCCFAQNFSRYLIFAELETISLVPFVAKNYATLSDIGIEIKLDPFPIFDVSDRLREMISVVQNCGACDWWSSHVQYRAGYCLYSRRAKPVHEIGILIESERALFYVLLLFGFLLVCHTLYAFRGFLFRRPLLLCLHSRACFAPLVIRLPLQRAPPRILALPWGAVLLCHVLGPHLST